MITQKNKIRLREKLLADRHLEVSAGFDGLPAGFRSVRAGFWILSAGF
ncbi:hypothetical protein [Aquisalibacillus elongatus]|nr:hypothetical protein [Aquisalibacillus elongatus]